MVQKVDPFIPVTKPEPPRPARTRPPINQKGSVDGIIQPPVHPERTEPLAETQFVGPRESLPRPPQPTRPISESRPQPPKHAQFAPTPQPHPQPGQAARFSRLKKMSSLILQSLIFMSLFAVGLLLQSVVVGQLLILAYAIFVFLFRIESRTTFALALISLAVVLIASVRSDTGLASTFAVYAFLFLVIGTMALGREVRTEA